MRFKVDLEAEGATHVRLIAQSSEARKEKRERSLLPPSNGLHESKDNAEDELPSHHIGSR